MTTVEPVNSQREAAAFEKEPQRKSHMWRRWARFRRNRLSLLALCVLVTMILTALLAPYINRQVLGMLPETIDLTQRLDPINTKHLLGTDQLGRDVLVRLIDGSRISLTIGVLVVCISNSIGLLVGGLAGHARGIVDNVIMRVVDALLSIPTLLLLLAILSAKPQFGLIGIILIIGLTSWMGPSRVVRGEFLSIRERDYVLAARALGGTEWQIIRRHILPNVVPTLIVTSTLGVAYAILTESALSFLGLGVQPPQASWGNMLMGAQTYLWNAPLLAVWPGLCIMLSVLSFNFVGDGLREALDPRL